MLFYRLTDGTKERKNYTTDLPKTCFSIQSFLHWAILDPGGENSQQDKSTRQVQILWMACSPWSLLDFCEEATTKSANRWQLRSVLPGVWDNNTSSGWLFACKGNLAHCATSSALAATCPRQQHFLPRRLVVIGPEAHPQNWPEKLWFHGNSHLVDTLEWAQQEGFWSSGQN